MLVRLVDPRASKLRLALLSAITVILIGVASAPASQFLTSNSDEILAIPAAASASIAATPVDSLGTVVATGETSWQLRHTVPDDDPISWQPWTLFEDSVYRTVSEPGAFLGIEAIDATTGLQMWRHESTYRSVGIAAGDDGVYFIDFGASTRDGTDSLLVALMPNSGHLLWRTELDGTSISLFADDGTIFVLDDRDRLTAIEASAGIVQWRYDPHRTPGNQDEPLFELVGKPAVGKRTIVFVLRDGSLVGINRNTGRERWRQDDVLTAPGQIDGTGDYGVVISAYAGFPLRTEDPDVPPVVFRVAGFNLDSGTVVWEQYVGSWGIGIAAEGDTVTVKGTPFEWTLADRDSYSLAEWEEGSDGVLVNEAGQVVRGLDVATGRELWTENLSAGSYTSICGFGSESDSAEQFAAGTTNHGVFPIGPWENETLDPYSPSGSPVVRVACSEFAVVVEYTDGIMYGLPVLEGARES